MKKDGEPELLIPAIRECVLKVDTEEGFVTVCLLDGLRELNTGNKKARQGMENGE